MRTGVFALGMAMAVGMLGCTGKKETPTAAAPAPSSTTAAAPQAIAVPPTASPDQVVTVFLNALKQGDKATTASLLTAKAREETAKRNLDVEPEASPNSKYAVRPAEFVPGGAHISSIWTEQFKNEQGQVVEEANYEIVWVLRQDPEGWRLVGMATELVPGHDKQFLNFEDPDDMIRKREEAIAMMQAPAAQTAQQPPGQPTTAPTAVER